MLTCHGTFLRLQYFLLLHGKKVHVRFLTDWCAIALFWSLSVRLDCVFSQSLQVAVMSLPLHRISWPKRREKCSLLQVLWLVGAMARQMRQQWWVPVHAPMSLFRSLCKSSGFPAAQSHFPTSLTTNEFLPKEFVFLYHHFLTGKKKFQSLLFIIN